MAEVDSMIIEHELVQAMGLPAHEGGFPVESPAFHTWLHLKMLIDFDTPLIDVNRSSAVDTHGRVINIGVFPIHRPHPSNLRIVCRSLERILLPCIEQRIERHHDQFLTHNGALDLAECHLDGLAKYILFQHTKLASWREDSNDLINV